MIVLNFTPQLSAITAFTITAIRVSPGPESAESQSQSRARVSSDRESSQVPSHLRPEVSPVPESGQTQSLSRPRVSTGLRVSPRLNCYPNIYLIFRYQLPQLLEAKNITSYFVINYLDN